ncbi:MAG TPA: xylulokinase [Acidimicrobiia bacterium]|nr:xylulokinase [Acidimicrobiia bacterium]
MSLVAGVDSSTQSCKIEVRDADSGELVRSGHRPHPPTSPPRSEQDPRAWWGALSSLLDEHGRDVAAVSVAGQQHGMVVLDADRGVVRPAKLWNDTESAPHADALVRGWGARRWADVVGTVPVASLTITKVAWLREHEPEHFARLAHVLLPHDWLTLQLSGELVTDRGDASGTGYWSPSSESYVPDALALVGLDPSVVPTVLAPGAQAGTFGDVVVAPGTGDNMGTAVGLGLAEGDLAISLGTSGTAFAVAGHPTDDASGAVAGFADATGRFLPLACTLNATKVTDGMARLLGRSRDELESLALAAPSGAGGVVLLPYFDGERTPNRPDATGTLTGLRSETAPAQLARAAYEGVVCHLLEAMDALARVGVPTDRGRLFVVGGGARSSVYPQLVADLAQRPVDVPVTAEYVARGACVQAAAVLTGRAVDEVAREWAPQGSVVEPNEDVDAAAVRAAYAELREQTHPDPGDAR